eukprot:m.112726 g.112726  ORF g.112726 m.112726 type:complete len:426 (+) comp16195_c0_seq3:189-1466(+)
MAKPPPSDTHAFTPNDVSQFSLCVYKVLKQVHPMMELSVGAQLLLGNLSACILTRAAEVGLELRVEMTPALVVRNFLDNCGEIVKHAVSECTKAITKRNMYLAEPERLRRRGMTVGATAGLQFPVEVLLGAAARHGDERLELFQDESFAVGLGATAEYLLAEVLELSGNRARGTIRVEHVSAAVRADEELCRAMPALGLMRGVTPEEAVDRFFDPFSPALMEAFTIGSGTAARPALSQPEGVAAAASQWAAPLGETPASVEAEMSRAGVDGVVVVGWQVSRFDNTPLLAADWVAPPAYEQSDSDDDVPASEKGFFQIAYAYQHYEQSFVYADIEMRGKGDQGTLAFRVELGYDALLRDFEDGVRNTVFATVFDAKANGVVIAGGYAREDAGPRIVLAPTAPAAVDKDKLEQTCAALGEACFGVWS